MTEAIPSGGSWSGDDAYLRTEIWAPGAPVGSAPQQGRFRVELDRLPQLRTELDAVKAMYDGIGRNAEGLTRLTAPGEDRVSLRAAAELSRWAGTQEGQLGWAAREAKSRVQDMIDQVDAIIAQYRDAEDSNEFPR